MYTRGCKTTSCMTPDRSRTEHLLIEKCSYFSVQLIKQNIFKPKCNCRKKSMQEKESVMIIHFELKFPSLEITVRHHSASLIMPNSYPRDGIFNLNLTTIEDFYNLTHVNVLRRSADKIHAQIWCVPENAKILRSCCS